MANLTFWSVLLLAETCVLVMADLTFRSVLRLLAGSMRLSVGSSSTPGAKETT